MYVKDKSAAQGPITQHQKNKNNYSTETTKNTNITNCIIPESQKSTNSNLSSNINSEENKKIINKSTTESTESSSIHSTKNSSLAKSDQTSVDANNNNVQNVNETVHHMNSFEISSQSPSSDSGVFYPNNNQTHNNRPHTTNTNFPIQQQNIQAQPLPYHNYNYQPTALIDLSNQNLFRGDSGGFRRKALLDSKHAMVEGGNKGLLPAPSSEALRIF